MLIRERVLEGIMGTVIATVQQSQRQKRLRASGRSAASLRGRLARNPNGLSTEYRGAAYWKAQNDGRGPNKSGKPSRQMVESIRDWTRFRGIPVEAAYPIAAKIAAEGITVPNRYNPGGVLSEPLSRRNIGQLYKPALRTYYQAALRQLLFGK